MAARAKGVPRAVSRIDHATATRLFPESQRMLWPLGYLPASGVAHFLRPRGVPWRDVVDAHREAKTDAQHKLHRDFAADYALWARGAAVEFSHTRTERERRLVRRWSSRDRTVRDADVRQLFGLLPYAPPRCTEMREPTLSIQKPSPSSSRVENGRPPRHPSQTPAATPGSAPMPATALGTDAFYAFSPYAATQAYAMMPVEGLVSERSTVHFRTFPELRNVMYTDFDPLGPLRALTLYAGDELVYTTELVQSIALYLRRRLDVLRQAEETFVASAAPQSDRDLRFSANTPIVAIFGNGRLAWAVNSTALLPSHIRPVHTPEQAARRERRRQRPLPEELIDALSADFRAVFPNEVLSVGDALRKYKPGIVLVEPHIDRDWLCNIRGFYTVREVLVLGRVDSPGLASFAYPFLSFGVTPGPQSYWTYNDSLQRVTASTRIQMPMDPPYQAQGYARYVVDTISAYLLAPYDCATIGRQYRCLSFRRETCPVLHTPRADQPNRCSVPAKP